ncbi:MAG: Calx-beta domain-containing protein, partial [Microcystaceae cyanobacterium]
SQDISYAIATSNATLTEGNSGSQPVTYTVTRTGATQNASSVSYSIGGSATNGSDYNSIGGTSGATGLTGAINFAVGETSKTITLRVLGDTTVESNETITATLSNPTAPGSASLTTSSATTTITNDDNDDGSTSIQQGNDPNGLVSFEAEQFNNNVSQGGYSWVSVNESGASGGKALQAGPDTGTNNNTGYVSNSPRLDYNINFVKTGTYYVWILGRAGGSNVGASDSVHAGLDGQAVSTADRISSFTGGYGWSDSTMDSAPATINVTSTGLHTFNLWMREDGFIVDKIILTLDPNFRPI